MRLKRLELQGFKSFLDRTILTFEDGVTGVVGPNGCGKSNIVDAILWVMGEQSPSHLRGENMTDVIFAGSDSRAPTSMAEVSLILDKQGVALSPQYAAFDRAEEITVTRRIYRDGTGEFLINKSACRLKDIHELFMDTGVGKRAYSVIQQGQIDRMINSKPEDRRLIFEEVAGITKYKAKRKEAERKLEATRGNMTRLQDILVELEKQIRSLKIQATRARKFKELKGELEVADLFFLGRSLFKLKRAIEELSTKRETLVAQRSEWDALLGQRDAEVTELEIRRLDQEKAYEALGAAERDLMLRIQKLESQLSLFDERRKNLIAQNESYAVEASELDSQIERLLEEQDATHVERETLGTTLSTLDAEIKDQEQAIREAQDRRYKAQNKKDVVQHRRNQNAQAAVSIETKKQNAEMKEQDLVESQSRLDAQLSELLQTIETLKASVVDADTKIEACTQRSEAAKQQVSAVSGECQEVSSLISQKEKELYGLREEFHSQRSRMQSLKELQENMEGYAPSAREILSKLKEEAITAVPLAEVLQPEAAVEEHLELLLGDDMNTLLVQTSADAEKLARLVESRGLERVRILALSEVGDAKTAAVPSGATPLLSRIRVQDGYEAAARHWLGDAYLVPDADALFTSRAGASGVTLVAQSGRTVYGSDLMLSSGVQTTSTGVFARRREIEELTAACATLEADLARVTAEREALVERLAAQEKLQGELKDQLSGLHLESLDLRKEKEKIQIELTRAERDHAGLVRDSERFATQLDDIRRQVSDWAEELARLTEEGETHARELAEIESEISLAAQSVESLNQGINERKVARSAQSERFNGIESRLLKVESEIGAAKRRNESIQAQRESNEAELAGFDASSSGIVTEKEDAQKSLTETQIRLADTKAAFNETDERLRTFRDELHDLQKKREMVLEELQDVELKLEREQSNFEHTRGISMERYQHEATPLDDEAKINLEQLPLFAAEVAETWEAMLEDDRHRLLQEHLTNLREKVGRYGEVNLTAITEFDEVQKRYDFLMEQRTDLDNSIKILEEAIVKIDESTKSRFSETFDAVQKKFGEIFPILFGGGKGELVLTNPENMLEAGVDIMVQPPGKRLQSISLLSGGEKAMTAVSLVLAIFARKPSPFCLLDEVDAPLDDANVSRFNTVIRKMSEKTQFIVITHNKKTMEIAEALYGVTMERAGVSKMTSVRLN